MKRSAMVVLAALLLTGCDAPQHDNSSQSDTKPVSKAPDGKGLNVWLITLDTTRADCFACYGHPTVKTPNIDALAADGTIFEQAISSIPITLPSHTTMMTGSYQFVHGVRDNGFFYVAEENVTLAEQFKEIGYHTEALVSAPVLDAKYGLKQGFDAYSEMGADLWVEQVEAKTDDGGSDPAMPEPVEENEKDYEYLYRPAAEMTALIEPRLEAMKDKPFFLWTHFFDPHLPNLAPEEWASKYDDQYFAEIAYFDHYFGKLLEKLRTLGLEEKTLIILTSDHGESRGQHGEHTHSYFIYDATQRVPLIMRLPGKIAAGQRVPTQVRLVDLAPTIRELVGLPETEQSQGVSLWPVLADPTLDLKLPAYADTFTAQFSFGFSPLRFIRNEGWKYIHSPNPELYNVTEDALELFNVATQQPDRVQAMKAALRQLIADSPAPPGGRASSQDVDAVDMERLEALGYVGGDTEATAAFAEGSELDHFEPVGEDPRQHLELLELNVMAMGAVNNKEFELAEKMQRRLLELDPDNPSHLKRLGDVVLAQERPEEALEIFQKALRLAPEDKNIRGVLGPIGWIYVQQGRNEEALEHFKLAQATSPNEYRPYLGAAAIYLMREQFDLAAESYEAATKLLPFDEFTYVRMAIAHKFAGNLEQAEKHLRYVLDRVPGSTEARLQLFNVLQRAGRDEEAQPELERAAREADDRGRVYRMLGVIHNMAGDRDQAYDAFVQAVEIDPDNADGLYNLGTMQMRRGDREQAIASFRKATERNAELGEAWYGLARGLQLLGRYEESVEPARRAVALKPASVSGHRVLADGLEVSGKRAAAIQQLQQALEQGGRDPLLLNDLAWRMATSADEQLRQPREALQLALEALEKAKDKRNAYDTVAAAYAAVGQFQEAVLAAKQAITLAEQAGFAQQAERMRARLELYQREEPYISK